MDSVLETPVYAETLPRSIRSRLVKDVNGIDMHVLEAGHEMPGCPVLLLLHGFPEFAFCWRRLMPLLASHGYHVIAPDQRGYVNNSEAIPTFLDDPSNYAVLNLATDMVSLVGRMGVDKVHAVIGHDFGALVAGMCALARPDLFHRLVLVGTPFSGAASAGSPSGVPFADDVIHSALARLDPPRKHYQLYFAGPDANEDMWRCPQGIASLLRGYYHQKSDDWEGNDPRPLAAWTAEELAHLPHYYCMPAGSTMGEVAAEHMPGAERGPCEWLTDSELLLIAAQFDRSGFQGPLQWYRSAVAGQMQQDLRLFAGRLVEVPTLFVAGKADWGTFQTPGALDAVQTKLTPWWIPIHIVEGAGHWIQQEQPDRLAAIVVPFLAQ